MSRSVCTLRVLVFLPVALCAFLPGAFAEEEPTSAERFLARVENLPPPAAAAAFTFDGSIRINGVGAGTYSFSAQPAEIEGETLWHLRGRGVFSLQLQQRTEDEESFFSRTLSALRGTMQRKDGDEVRAVRWERSEAGIRVTVASGEEESERVVKHPGHAIHGLAPIILFCRMVLPEKGTYEITDFDPLPGEGKESIKQAEIVLWESGEWHGTTATLVRGIRGGRRLVLAFDPVTRDFLGLRATDDNGMVLEVLPGKTPEETPGDDEFQLPAKSAEDAALVAALAYGTANGDLLVDAVHWPTAFAAFIGRHPEATVTEEKLRELVREGLNRYSGKKPRDTITMALRLIRSQLVVEREGDDRAVVTFPESFKNLVLKVGKVGESWFLIDIPGT